MTIRYILPMKTLKTCLSKKDVLSLIAVSSEEIFSILELASRLRRAKLGLDEESLTSREKPIEEGIKIKTIDTQTRSKEEQTQQEVHKVSVKNLEAWFGTKQALKNI